MQECYFFRNVKNFDELKMKTERAIEKRSPNLKKYYIAKKVVLNEKEFMEFLYDFTKNRKYIYDNLLTMRIDGGIWNCVSFTNGNIEILVMSDGYQYPRFLALI